VLACGAALGVAACAVAAAPVWADDDGPETPYGAYLAARWADALQSPEDAARYYSEALERDPGNAMLVSEAFHAALLAADWDLTVELGEAVLESDPANAEARLALAADAMGKGEWRRATRLLDQAQMGPLDNIVGSVLLAWSRAGAGDEEGALAALARPDEAALFSALVGLHQAMLLDRAGDPSAETSLQTAMDAYALPGFAAREYGRFLERRDRAEAAREIYLQRLMENPDDRMVRAELARLDAGDNAPRMPAADAASLALYGAAAALMGRDFSDRAQTYLILAVRLDGEFSPARMLLGEIMIGQGRLEQAEEMFRAAIDDPAVGVEARIRLAQIEAARGETAAAEEMLRALWEDDGTEDSARALADALRATEKWDEAEALLTQLLDARAASGQGADWRLLYGRAVTRERQDNWPQAEEDFRAAIALNPDDPTLLNYLGYAMVDRGKNLDEGFELIRRAVALAPREGFIIDSLGWAYYRLGEYDEAVTNLERAAALAPGQADINDHLGDAYWRVGRELEARFQWQRALTLEPEPDLRSAIETKLAAGLPPAGEAPALAENK